MVAAVTGGEVAFIPIACTGNIDRNNVLRPRIDDDEKDQAALGDTMATSYG